MKTTGSRRAGSNKKDASAQVGRPKKQSAQRGAGNRKNDASGKNQDGLQATLSSALNSTLFRRVVAAGLTAAAAALLYKKSDSTGELGTAEPSRNGDAAHVPIGAKPATHKRLKKKVAAAVDTATKATQAAAQNAAPVAVSRKVKAATTKATKALRNAVDPLLGGESDPTPPTSAEKVAKPESAPTPRKKRSDAGTKRQARSAMPAPERSSDFGALPAATESEASALAMGSALVPVVSSEITNQTAPEVPSTDNAKD